MRRGIRALIQSMLVLVLGCHEPKSDDADDDDRAPTDVQALVWCVLSSGFGETAEGEEVVVRTTGTNRGACLCLPVGTQPYTGSDLDVLLHDMAIDKCEEDLRALDAVTTDCEERVGERPVDYESSCDPDDWPPPPI